MTKEQRLELRGVLAEILEFVGQQRGFYYSRSGRVYTNGDYIVLENSKKELSVGCYRVSKNDFSLNIEIGFEKNLMEYSFMDYLALAKSVLREAKARGKSAFEKEKEELIRAKKYELEELTGQAVKIVDKG